MVTFTRKKGNKYKNKKVVVDGIEFDSTKEGKRYSFLKMMEKQGVIKDLQLQVRYELIPSIKEKYIEHLKTKDKEKERVLQQAINYICDFQYIKNGKIVVEDVKASEDTLTKEFSLKNKLFFWKYGFHIILVYDWNKSV